MTTTEKKLLRLANACGDFEMARTAYGLYKRSRREDLNYQLILSLVTCYGRPFTENTGVGSLHSDYPGFPDFAEEEMNRRHWFFIAMRNQFFAHSSIAGVRVMLVPPGVMNPADQSTSDEWGMALGKRTFSHEEYREHINWAYPVIPALIERLKVDISRVLPRVGSRHRQAREPFDLDARAEDFDFRREIERLAAIHRDRAR